MSNPKPDPFNSQDMQTYNTIADSVGFVPNLRAKDNIFQLIVVAIFVVLGLIAGLVVSMNSQMELSIALLLGALIGFIIGGVLSGFVLMILGWIRTAKTINNK